MAAVAPTSVFESLSQQSSPLPDNKLGVAVETPVPMANVEDISLVRLQAADPVEDAKLLKVGLDSGIFYLNLLDGDGRPGRLLTASEAIYRLAEELFGLSGEEKLAYDVDRIGGRKRLNGYKPIGRNFGGIKGNRDGFESYAVAKDVIFGLQGPCAATAQHPAVIEKYKNALREFTAAVNDATTAILDGYSRALGLADGSGALAQQHRVEEPSSDMLRLLKYHDQGASERGAPQSAHTDLGTLTVLFSKQPGLQVRQEDGEWRFVRPARSRAVINLGDAMALLSAGSLRSCLHRVVPLPGRPMATRYSFAYMRRPEDHVPMAGLRGALVTAPSPAADGAPVVTAGDWLLRKFGALRFDSHEKGEKWVLTGHKA